MAGLPGRDEEDTEADPLGAAGGLGDDPGQALAQVAVVLHPGAHRDQGDVGGHGHAQARGAGRQAADVGDDVPLAVQAGGQSGPAGPDGRGLIGARQAHEDGQVALDEGEVIAQGRGRVTTDGGGQGNDAPVTVQGHSLAGVGTVDQVGPGRIELGKDGRTGPDRGEHVGARRGAGRPLRGGDRDEHQLSLIGCPDAVRMTAMVPLADALASLAAPFLSTRTEMTAPEVQSSLVPEEGLAAST